MNLRKIKRYGVLTEPLFDPGGRSVRKGLRRDKPVMRSGALVTIGFFNPYLAMRYPFLFLKDRRSWLPALSMLGYWAVRILGAIIFPNRGVSQPISAILTIALDSKLAIMTFAFAWLFKRTGSATQVFESLSILTIILCLINIPFIVHDLISGVSIKGNPLEVKGVFVQPQGLYLHQTEVAWVNAFGAFVAATRYRLRKRTLDLMLSGRHVNASFRIAAAHFPLGTGGGTFGSAASYQYGYSQVYYDYGIYLLWGGSPDFSDFLQDAYWPKVIGEGGALGVIFYLLFLVSCGVYIFYRDPNATFADEILRRLCLALLSLILVISVASSPFTDDLLTFVAPSASAMA